MIISDITKKDIVLGKAYRLTDESGVNIEEFKGDKIPQNSGMYYISGEITLNSGDKYPSLLLISSDDSGEMFGYNIFTDSEVISSEDDVEKKLGKKSGEVFPFIYHLNVKIEGDEHLDNQY